MNRDQKVQLVSTIKEDLLNSQLVVLLHYRGLSDKALYDLRRDLKAKDAKLKIAKNTLIKVAIKDTKLDILDEHLSGPTAIAYANDPVGLAKVVIETSKSNNLLKVQIGCLNQEILPKDAIGGLSKLGSLEEVRATFVGTIKGAQSSFVRVIAAAPTGMVSLLNNYASSKK
jgi:large subunit ribosomal protein L10